MATYSSLLEQARELPDEERWALGRALLEDAEDDGEFFETPEIAQAWHDEIERRMREAVEHPERLISGEEAFARLFGGDPRA